MLSSANPNAARNSPTRAFAVDPEYADIIKKYGDDNWCQVAKEFMENKNSLSDSLSVNRDMKMVSIQITDSKVLEFTPAEHNELQKLAKDCTAGIVYVTAFLDRTSFKKFVGEIAWETEVWISSEPDHLIHFNGQRFLGPY